MSYFVSLDGVTLRSVCNAARIVDVVELRPKRTLDALERLGTPGSILLRDHLDSRQVRVQFALLSANQSERTWALSDITAWAMNGKWLQIADRPEQQLRVICTETPQTTSKRNWTELCDMTFTAYALPFWEDCFPIRVKASAVTAQELHITPPGNVRQVPLRCKIIPTGGTLDTLTLAANGAEMAFSGLAVPAGQPFSIDYEDGILTANTVEPDGVVRPCLRFRSGDEGIPLHPCRDNAVRITASTACDVTLSAKGWYW